MGYDYHITRAERWADSEQAPISQAEWEALAENIVDLSQDSYVEWLDIGRQKTYTVVGEDASFSWSYGKVDILGTFTQRVKTVAQKVASLLGGHIQGDDD